MKRIASIDIYRGFVMFLMMAEVWRLSDVSQALPESKFWSFLAFHQSHVPWVGCSLHDLIQPSFTFLVGVVLPFSIISRSKKGQSKSRIYFHVFKRALILILLGIFLRSMHSDMTQWRFDDTLTQIGLGYPFLFLIGNSSFKKIGFYLVIILIGYWLFFALYPLPGANFDYELMGISKDWEHQLSGFAAHWNKNTNAGHAFDLWFMNLFPRENTFYYYSGGYLTLSFIPTLGTMLLGLVAGKFVMKSESPIQLMKTLFKIGIPLILVGIFLHFMGINPIVKRIWTPAWVLFSGGICFSFLAGFTYLVDILNFKKSFFWLKVIGMNSIAAYVIAHVADSFIDHTFQIHFGKNYANILGVSYQSLVSGSLILLIEWLLMRWMYRKEIFIKI